MYLCLAVLAFVAVYRLSLVVENGGCSLVGAHRLTAVVLLIVAPGVKVRLSSAWA